jgi:hypothetical protein
METFNAFKVKALYDYHPLHEDDLHFGIGQIITITEEEDENWYLGEYTDSSGTIKNGLIPRNLVERYAPELPPRPTRVRASKVTCVSTEVSEGLMTAVSADFTAIPTQNVDIHASAQWTRLSGGGNFPGPLAAFSNQQGFLASSARSDFVPLVTPRHAPVTDSALSPATAVYQSAPVADHAPGPTAAAHQGAPTPPLTVGQHTQETDPLPVSSAVMVANESLPEFQETLRFRAFDDNPGILRLAVSPDGQYLVVGAGRGATVWTIREDGIKKIQTTSFSSQTEQDLTVLRFSPNGSWLACGTTCGYIVLLRMNGDNGLQYKASYQTKVEVVRDLTFSPDGMWLMSRGSQLEVWATNLISGLQLANRTKGITDIWAAVISPKSTCLAIGFAEMVEIRNMKLQTMQTVSLFLTMPSALAWSPCSNNLVIAEQKRLRQYRMDLGGDFQFISPLSTQVPFSHVAYSPDGRELICFDTYQVQLYGSAPDGRIERLRQAIEIVDGAQDFVWLPNSQGLVIGCEDGTVRLWKKNGTN